MAACVRARRVGGDPRDRIRKQLRALPPASVIGGREAGVVLRPRPAAAAAAGGSFREEPPSPGTRRQRCRRHGLASSCVLALGGGGGDGSGSAPSPHPRESTTN